MAVRQQQTLTLSPKEAGALLGLSTPIVYRHIAQKRLDAKDMSTGSGQRPRWRIARTEIERFKAAQREKEERI